MATCKICGSKDRNKPNDWTNWDCPKCARDELWESAGQLNQQEKTISTVNHAWPAELGHKEVR